MKLSCFDCIDSQCRPDPIIAISELPDHAKERLLSLIAADPVLSEVYAATYAEFATHIEAEFAAFEAEHDAEYNAALIADYEDRCRGEILMAMDAESIAMQYG